VEGESGATEGSFERKNIEDVTLFERHVQNLIEVVKKEGRRRMDSSRLICSRYSSS
jgi:hypothetical protein